MSPTLNRNDDVVHYGTGSCGHVGQLFRSGKCANCYIADLEYLHDLVLVTTGRESITEAMVEFKRLLNEK